MKPVKQYHQDMVHYLKASVDVSADGVGSKLLGTLPAGCAVVGAAAHVSTAFDGDAPALTVGTNGSDYDDLLATVTETAIGSYANHSLALPVDADTDVYARVAESGAGTTVGAASLYILYAPDNS